MNGWNTKTLRCNCHDLDVCPTYEAECSEYEHEQWWASLTDEERASYELKLCINCSHAFAPVDDDREQEVCSDCVDWLDVYESEGFNF